MTKNQIFGLGTRSTGCRREAAQGGCAGYLVVVMGAAREFPTTFPIVAKSAQWISDVRSPLRPPPLF